MTNYDHFDNCDNFDKKLVENIKEKMLEDTIIFDLADLFKIIGDSTRIKILWALKDNELCVCELSNILNMSMSAISHQLKTLKNSNMVTSIRDGKSIFYSLCDKHVHDLIEIGLEHSEEVLR